MANLRATTAVSKSKSEHPQVRAVGSSPVKRKCSSRTRATFHKRAHLAHLCRRAPHDNPYLCRTRSTFPPMTTGTISGILESYLLNNAGGGVLAAGYAGRRYTHHPYSSRRYLESIQAVRTAPALKRKGRNHENEFIRMVASGAGRGAALCLLRCIPPTGAQFEPVVVAGIASAARHKHRAEPVPVLPPAPPGPSHWSRSQYASLKTLWAIKASHKPTSNHSITDRREGHCASLQAWAHGRRDQL